MFFSRMKVRSELSRVATKELSPWRNFVCHAKQTTEELNRLNQTEPTIFVFDVARGKVRTWPKPDCEVSRFFLPRVALYRDFIEEIIGRRWGFATTFGFCVGDYAVENDLVPLLAFQKRKGDRSILFPDPDFLHCEFYADLKFIDTLAFEAKSNTAVFAGSTTGLYHSGKNPARRSAAHKCSTVLSRPCRRAIFPSQHRRNWQRRRGSKGNPGAGHWWARRKHRLLGTVFQSLHALDGRKRGMLLASGDKPPEQLRAGEV